MGALLSRPLPFIIIRRLLSWRCCCDHCLSSSSWRQNYLYLAHSKLRNCSFGPVRHREDTACACCDTAFHRRPLPFTAFRRGSAHCRSCWWRTSPAACREPPGSGAARPPAFSPSFCRGTAVAITAFSSLFTALCRGTAVAITAFRHLSPPFIVALLWRSPPFVIFHRLVSWHCCCDHRRSSSFTTLCRGTAVAITASSNPHLLFETRGDATRSFINASLRLFASLKQNVRLRPAPCRCSAMCPVSPCLCCRPCSSASALPSARPPPPPPLLCAAGERRSTCAAGTLPSMW